MARSLYLTLFGSLALIGLVVVAMVAFANGVPRMSVEELSQKLNDANIVVIDVRSSQDWRGSDQKIRGAVRQVPFDAAVWGKDLDKSKTYVLYCA